MDIRLNYGMHQLRGTATLLHKGLFIELDSLGGASLGYDEAARTLATAVADGRVKVDVDLHTVPVWVVDLCGHASRLDTGVRCN